MHRNYSTVTNTVFSIYPCSIVVDNNGYHSDPCAAAPSQEKSSSFQEKGDSSRPATPWSSQVAVHRQHAPVDLEQVFRVPMDPPRAHQDGHRHHVPEAWIRFRSCRSGDGDSP